MRLLSAVKAAAFLLAFAPVAAIATPATNATLTLNLGNPFVNFFAGVAGTAVQVSNPTLLGVNVAASGSDIGGSSVGTATGTFINFNGGAIDFSKGANTLNLNDFNLDLTTGQFTADLVQNGTDLGRQNVFHFTGGGPLALADLAGPSSISIGVAQYTNSQVPLLDKNGNVVRDKNGNIVYTTVIVPASAGTEAFFLTSLANFGTKVAKGFVIGTAQVNVPEPATLALFGLGATMFGLGRRRAK